MATVARVFEDAEAVGDADTGRWGSVDSGEGTMAFAAVVGWLVV
jgi:hypothetical protein